MKRKHNQYILLCLKMKSVNIMYITICNYYVNMFLPLLIFFLFCVLVFHIVLCLCAVLLL